MANKRVSLFSFGKIMLKCGRVLSSQPPQTDLQSPSLHWAPLKHVVCLLKVYHSWVPDKQEHIVMQIVAIPRGLCWGWWRPLLGKTLSAVSCWGDIFIEQLEQTAFCILFYTVPKVLVPSISASLTHTHTYPRCLFLLTHSRRHQPSNGGRKLNASLQTVKERHTYPSFLSWPLFVKRISRLLICWLPWVGFMKSFWIFSRVGYKGMLSTSHMWKWFPGLFMPSPPHPTPPLVSNTGLSRLLVVQDFSLFLCALCVPNCANTGG